MSQGSDVAALAGAVPPANSALAVSAAAAARISSARLARRSRGLTVMVESAFAMLTQWAAEGAPGDLQQRSDQLVRDIRRQLPTAVLS
jgi:hypothetical protein